MNDRKLYEQILGIVSPWHVEQVELKLGDGQILVRVEGSAEVEVCPKCGKRCPRYDSSYRQWRHLDTCQYQTILSAKVPRIKCGEHGVLQVRLPWAEERSRFTALFEALVIDWLAATESIAAVAKGMRLSWDEVAGIRSRAVARAMLRHGRRAEATYEHLKEVLRNSRIVYPDETGWRVGGAKAWLWAMTTVTETVYLIERGRGFPEAAKILGELFAGIIGSDGWAPYRGFTRAERQLCLAHLLRRRKELLEAPPTAECANFFEQIKTVLKDALALRDRRKQGTITPHGFRSRQGKIQAAMDRLLDDPDLHDESLRFALHLLTNRDALFLFLDHPDLEATNHLAEKAIRPAVINRKTSGGNRTFNGAQAQAVIMSILRTAKLRCISAIDVLADMLRAPQPVPYPLMR